MKNFITRVPNSSTEKPQKSKPGPYVDLMIDRNFKLFFGSEKRKDLLLALLQVFIPELNIVSVELGPQEHPGREPDLVSSVFDVNCRTADGRTVVVEAQYNSRKDYIDRMLYYATWPIDEQIRRSGSNNYTLSEVFIISFTNFALVHDSDWGADDSVVSSYSLREDGNFETMTRALNFRYVELGRFNKEESELETVRDWWLYILKNIGHLSKELELRLSEGGDVLNRLLSEVRVEGMSKTEKLEYYKNMRNSFDIQSEKWYARQEGLEEGLAKGEEAKAKAIARNLKEMGLSPEQIAKATGLPENEII